MKYSVDKRERFSILKLDEQTLNYGNAPDLKSEFVVLINEGVPNLIFDLSAVEFVDSSGLSSILTANRLWTGKGGSFVMAGVTHEPVKKLIEISRLGSILTIIPTVDEAVDFVMMEELTRELQGDGANDEE